MTMLKQKISKIIQLTGYKIQRASNNIDRDLPVEFSKGEIAIIDYIMENELTMTSVRRLVNTLKSCKYAVDNNLSGDFVECGVWRGGNGILAGKFFDLVQSKKKVWMYDTFEGMTEPTEVDVSTLTDETAQAEYEQKARDSHNEWCYASLEDVKFNCSQASVDLNTFKFIKGDVFETLSDESNIPEKISVLRLDTDWYKSTKFELDVLYPRLVKGGVLIIDDYGSWEGSRKAVDEYFSRTSYKPLFNMIDFTGRTAIKM